MSAPSIIMPLRSLLTMIAAMAVLVAGIGLSGEIATRLVLRRLDTVGKRGA